MAKSSVVKLWKRKQIILLSTVMLCLPQQICAKKDSAVKTEKVGGGKGGGRGKTTFWAWQKYLILKEIFFSWPKSVFWI